MAGKAFTDNVVCLLGRWEYNVDECCSGNIIGGGWRRRCGAVVDVHGSVA